MSFLLDPFNWDPINPDNIPFFLQGHITIVLESLLIALVIAVPFALLCARFRTVSLFVISLAGAIYTIPSVAAMVLLIPFTLLNPPTIIIPLVAYAQITLIRNIVSAIRAVDPALVDVGRAMGMNWWQLQLRVVTPQALPLVIAGLRVTTVTTIGITAVGSFIGQPTLGFFVFNGIETSYNDEILAGAILMIALAVGADLALLLIQRILPRLLLWSLDGIAALRYAITTTWANRQRANAASAA
ncbi:MAG TPA: ABC transporter permease [Ktedonobacterales bacterium]|nr:ABC transporter permease [Ktedonobacterales bacterium]